MDLELQGQAENILQSLSSKTAQVLYTIGST